MSLNVFSGHTYTHETLFNALDKGMKVVSVPLPARAVERPSRLISSLPKHVWRAGTVVLQSILRYRPFQAYGLAGLIFALAGLVPFSRFLYLAASGDSAGHIQSLVIGAALLLFGAQLFVLGLLATAIGWNRRMLEDVLARVRELQLDAEASSGDKVVDMPAVAAAERPRRERVRAA
jgi:hypothetical protein